MNAPSMSVMRELLSNVPVAVTVLVAMLAACAIAAACVTLYVGVRTLLDDLKERRVCAARRGSTDTASPRAAGNRAGSCGRPVPCREIHSIRLLGAAAHEATEMDFHFGLELVWILLIAFYITWKSGKATGAREERERRKTDRSPAPRYE
jgi:hypothetical protein